MASSILPTIKILVVDDHPSTAQTLARAIAQIGPRVEVFSATSGIQALEYTKGSSLDIVITDMVMPEMTGLELIEQLQKRPVGRPTFSFLITAYEVPGLHVSARRLKVKDIINKPVHPERICQIVSQSIQEMDNTRPAASESSPNKTFTILIADDQPDNLTLLSRYLDREGYDHIQASNGLEALELVRTQLPDLVLLDVNMPHKDGFAVLKEIRTDPITEHIPVIILTAARLDAAEIQSGLNMGADDYVTKPFDHKELLARIHTKLRVKQAEDMIRRQNRELKLLPEIGKELSARLNLEDIADVLLKRTGETLGALLGHIVILNPSGAFQKTHYCDDSSPSRYASFTLPKKLLLEIANDARQGFIVEDTHTDPYWTSIENDSARSVVVVPMFGRYHLLGVMLLGNDQVGYFKLEHLLLLQAICSQASIAIENAQLNETMAQERQHMAAVLQSAADAILLFDVENRLSLANPAGQKLFTDYEMKIGRQFARGTGYDRLIQSLQDAKRSGTSFTGEIEWPDQRVFSAAITSVKEGGCVVVLHDISRFKELEKVKDEFIATASHDLRNPITSINGFSYLMKQAGPLNDMQSDFLTRIQDAAVQMSQLVDNMLNLAKMDLGQEIKREKVDLPELVTKVVDEFKPHAQAKRQNLTLEQASSGSSVLGDVLQLLQALRNLVGNAVKYTPEDGSITINLEQKDGRLLVKVRDTGYGIPAASLPFVFNRFYRVRNNGHSEIEGTGLGLAIVKSIIEQHDGEITVESEPGVGSCFTISLPSLAKVNAPQPQRISSTKYNRLERGTQ
jgi:signal transduction histidine kinase/response regulator RpfG family c-di-GMP phosphodiesterase